MKNSRTVLILVKSFAFVLFALLAMHVQAADEPKQLPEFNKEQVDSLSHLKKYQYEIAAKPPISFWQKIKWFLKKLVTRIFGDSFAAVSFRYVILTLVVVLVVFQLLRADLSGLFFKKNRSSVPLMPQKNKNIFRLNLDHEIHKAIANDNYTDAVRYYYLKALKTLHQKGYIDWAKNKTNTEFLCEIKEPKVEVEFKQLSSWFEYAVYGDFTLGVEQFERMNQSFANFISELNNQPNHE